MANSKKPKDKLVYLRLPEDPEWLAAIGRISLLSSHLDHVMRMTAMVITGIDVAPALQALAKTPARHLRERVRSLAKERLGDGPAFLELEAILYQAEMVAEERNRLVHAVVVHSEEGDAIVQDPIAGHTPLPSIDELNKLATAFEKVYGELNDSRLRGSLSRALNKRKKKW